MKRIRVTGGYQSNETKSLFAGSTETERKRNRKLVSEQANLQTSEYFAAVTEDMEETVKSLDPGLAGVLNIRFLLVKEGGSVEQLKPW